MTGLPGQVAGFVARHAVGLMLALAVGSVATAWVAVDRWITAREVAAVAADRATREIADLRAELAARAAAADVHRAHLRRMAAEAAARDDLIRDLLTMEGLDAPLSPALAAVAGRLWGGR